MRDSSPRLTLGPIDGLMKGLCTVSNQWIKMRANLRSHPKVVRIASAMHCHKLTIVGGLHAIWSLFDEHSEDGRLSFYTLDDIDSEVGMKGFGKAMVDIGWLIANGDVVELPEFSTHNGQSAKRRATDAERKRASREAPNPVRNLSANGHAKTVTREEKSRDTVPKGTGAAAPVVVDNSGLEIWTTGPAFLIEKGVKESNARSVLGGLRKRYGDKAVADALHNAIVKDVSEPVSWLQRALEPKQRDDGQAWRADTTLMMAKASELGVYTIGKSAKEVVDAIDKKLGERIAA